MLFITPKEAQQQVALTMRQHRIDTGLTQEVLAQKSSVPVSSLRKFERTGKISLESLLKLAVVLGLLEGLVESLKPKPILSSLDEMIAADKKKPRQRARK